jgi:hypothetical protein
VIVVGLAATMLALYAVQSTRPVYYSRAESVFLVPSSFLVENTLQVRGYDLVITAGVVAKRVNGMDALPKASTMEASSVDRNVLDGTLITLPDHGNQWAPYYDTGALKIEVSAPTAELARERMERAFDRIAAELDEVQDELGVRPRERVTVQRSVAVPVVHTLGGRPRSAQVMTIVLGLSMTLTGVGLLELRARRRKS